MKINYTMILKSVLTRALSLVIIMMLGNSAFAQPQNDDPCNAIFLDVQPTCNMQMFTNEDATGSTGVPAPGCSNYQGGDVWFQVLVPQEGAIVIKTEPGIVTDGAVAVYTGTCDNLTLVACDDDSGPGLMPELAVGGLTPNTIVYIRFFEYFNDNQGTFNICVTIPPPPPANDDCSGAISVPVNPDMNCTATVSGTTEAALPSSGVNAPSCGATGANDDVWFSFVATGSSHIISLLNVTGSTTDMVMALYSGSCGAMTEIRCSDPNTMTVGGLTAGDTYYVRVWTWSSSTNLYANFDICIGTPPPPPSNDECSGAIALTVNPDLNCGVVTPGTVAFATGSTGVPTTTCNATGTDDDVWYSFVATGPSHVVSLLNVTGSITDMVMALYDGTPGCGNAMTHLVCSDPNTMVVGGLTAGNTYYVRVYTWGTTTSANNAFNICVGTPPPPPANDECAGAYSIPVNTSFSCVDVFAGSTVSSTTSSSAPTPSCGATGINDDVWFSFVALNTSHTISLTNFSGGSSDMVMVIYSGTCGSLSEVRCSDPESTTVTGLTPGETYYIRVYTWSSTTTTTANFDICITTPPPAPSNDDPCDAILLTVNENGDCNWEEFHTYSATSTSGVPAPGCSFYQGGDVWFKFVVPCTGSVIINTNTGNITDGGMAWYTGSCGNLTLLECDDDDSPNGLMPMITRNNLTPGDTIWVRFWEYGNDVQGTFRLCATVPPPPPPAASCATAMPFCTSTTPTTVPNITGQPSLGGSGDYGCLFTIPNPTYYYLQIQQAGDITIRISQTSTTGTGLDVDFIVWGPYNSLDEACGGISAANIVDCSYSINAIEFADIPNAQVGQFYLFLVTNYSNQPGTITYQQTAGSGSSDCAVVCEVEAFNNSPVCANGGVDLSSTNITNGSYHWTGPACFESFEQNPTEVPVPTAPGSYMYTVIVTDPNGTRCMDTTMVTVVANPDLGDDVSANICGDSSFDLTGVYDMTDLTATWTFGGQNVNNPGAVSDPGAYEVIATSAIGCTDTAVVTLDVSQLALDATFTQANCLQEGEIIAVASNGDEPYQYTLNATSNNDGIFSVTSEGQYVVSVTDNSNCSVDATVNVVFEPMITVDAGPDVSIYSAESVQLNATTNVNPVSVIWTPATGLSNPGILNPSASPEITTTYTIEVTNAQGCLATDDVTITVIPLCMNLRNAFSPNGDGINDKFEVYNSFGCLNKVTVQVFNRYGSKVFESKDYRNTWDGTYKGKPLPDGTYYAVVTYYLTNGKMITRKTDLTIIR